MPKASSKQKQRPSEPIARNSSLKRYPRSLNPVKEQDIGQDPTPQKKDLLSYPAVKYASDMTDTKSTSRQPGYVTPARRGKVSLKAFVDPKLRDDFKKVAKMLGATSDALLTDVVTAVVEQYNNSKEVPELLTKEAEKHYQKSVQQAASRLVSALIPK